MAENSKDRFLAHAHECLVLADRFVGSLSERSFRAAADSWFMLANLEDILPGRGGARSFHPAEHLRSRPSAELCSACKRPILQEP